MMILDRRNKALPLTFGYFLCDINNYIRIALSFISIFVLLIMSKDVMDTMGIVLKNGTGATKLFSFLSENNYYIIFFFFHINFTIYYKIIDVI